MNRPLVSIIVITYNSAEYILETLNSIATQSYEKLELIISDDYSSDGTIEICKEWLSHYSDRFERVCCIESPRNTGISENINRGYKMAQGEWIHDIAGDDILTKDCISDNINFISQKKDAQICFSNCMKFITGSSVDGIDINNGGHSLSLYDNMTSQEQFKALLRLWQPSSATMFIQRSLIEEYNYFDNSYPFMEDYPLLIKLTKNGIKLHLFDKITAFYRIDSGVCSNANPIVSRHYYDSRKMYFFNYLRKQYPLSCFFYKYHNYVCFFYEDIIIKYFHSRQSRRAMLFRKLFAIIDPIAIKLFLYRIKNKSTN